METRVRTVAAIMTTLWAGAFVVGIANYQDHQIVTAHGHGHGGGSHHTGQTRS